MNKCFSKKMRFFITALTVCSLLFTLFVGVTANAASGGKGTKSDPYLLKTAADVQNMQKDLKAHYKLAATIDLSSIKEFQPVGCLGEPFTGSLTCDLGADGLPRYALLNLNIYNHAGEVGNHVFAQAGSEYYINYDKSGFSKYESGLFGTTDGAMISNILVLKANVKSTVVGQHQGVYYGTERKMCAEQVDNQATAILVGIAKNTSINACGVQGNITSDSNQTAGLVGKSISSTISYCWADINSKTRGFWYSAGLVGLARDSSSIVNSYAKGEIHCTSGTAFGLGNGQCGGGLVAAVLKDCWVNDSYSEVNFAKGSIVAGTFSASKLDDGVGTFKNVYSTGVQKEVVAIEGAKANNSNCWTLNVAGQKQDNFKLGSAADIKAAFTGLKGWNTSGNLPTIANLKYVTDYSIFVAGKERAGAGAIGTGNNNNNNNNNNQGSGNTGNNNANTNNASNGGNSTQDPTISDGGNGTVTDPNVPNDGTNTSGSQNEQGVTETIVQDGYRNSTTYIVLFICLTAVVICITVASLSLLLKSMEKVKRAKGQDIPEDLFSNSDFDINQ